MMAKKKATPSEVAVIQEVLRESVTSFEKVDKGQDGDKFIVQTASGAKLFCRLKRPSETEELPFQESEVLMATESTHIIKPTHTDTIRGWNIIIRPYIEGMSLADRLRERELTELEIRGLAITLVDVAESLREAGAVHFDIKPENIVCGADGGFYLIDFGAAKMLQKMTSERIRPARKYIPPEVLEYLFNPSPLALRRLNILSDMYGIGAVLYECLTGTKISDVFRQSSDILQKAPRPVLSLNPRANATLATLADRLLLKDPSQRLMPRDARALLDGTLPTPITFPHYFLETISGQGNEHSGMLSTIFEDGDQVGLYFLCDKRPSFPNKAFLPKILWESKSVPAIEDIGECLLAQQESGAIALCVPGKEIEGPIQNEVLASNLALVRAAVEWRTTNCPHLPILAVIAIDAGLLTTREISAVRDSYAALDVHGIVLRVCVPAYGGALNENQLRGIREFISYWAGTEKPVMFDGDIHALALSRFGVTSWIGSTSPRLSVLQSRARPVEWAQRPDHFYGRTLLGMLRPDDVISMRRTPVLRPVTDCNCRHCGGLRRRTMAGNWTRDDRRKHFLSIIPKEMQRIRDLNVQDMRDQVSNARSQMARFRPGIVLNLPHLDGWTALFARD
jgi:serine/threonine protein kinase